MVYYLVIYKKYINFVKNNLDMAIVIIDTTQFSIKLKATIQATGKLGFTNETANCLNLQLGQAVNFARDDETQELYLIIAKDSATKTLKVCKSGMYYYIQTKLMFDAFGYDYKKKTIIFDLTRKEELDESLNGRVYKMSKRELIRKNMKS